MNNKEIQKGIDKFFNKRDFEMEFRICHIGGDHDIENVLKTLYFICENDIPYLIEVPRHKLEVSESDIIVNLTRKEIIKLCGFFKGNRWPMDCLHLSRFPLKYNKSDGKLSIEGQQIEYEFGNVHYGGETIGTLLTFQNLEGLLKFHDICERSFNDEDLYYR